MRFSAIRLHYLLVYAALGAYMPYLPVFLGRDLGMHDAQIGWITGIYGLSVILGPPLITYLADRLSKPVLVEGPAGTGKTQVLSARVLRLLLNGNTDPSQILCLTFTKLAAAEMQDHHRKRQQELHPDLTLTGLYNVLEAVRAGGGEHARAQQFVATRALAHVEDRHGG